MLLPREEIAALKATAQHILSDAASRADPLTLQECLALNSIHERLMRGDYIYWCEQASHIHCVPGEDPTPAPVHRIIMYWVDSMLRGETKRLLMSLPPGTGKSTYSIKLGAPHFLANNPRKQIILSSSSTKLIWDQSSAIRKAIDEFGPELGIKTAGDNREHWKLDNDASLLAVSANSNFQGHRGDLIFCDDLIGDVADVRTELMRQNLWEWFEYNMLGRLRNADSAIAIINTRWHEDDIHARVLERKNNNGEWVYINLKALWEEDYDEPGFPYGLGRKANSGAPLWDIKEKMYHEAREGAEPKFQAQYQGEPTPRQGLFFRAEAISTVEAAPATNTQARGWDLAASNNTRSDWTVGVKMVEREGVFVITDIVRLRGDHAQVKGAVMNTAAQDTKRCKISLPLDPGQAGKAQAEQYASDLRGYRVRTVTQGGKANSKQDRARGLGAQVDAGNVRIVAGIRWAPEALDELKTFPNGRHDDIVDACAAAFNELAVSKRKPVKTTWTQAPHFRR